MPSSNIQIRAFTLKAAPTVEGDRRVKFVASTPAVDSHGTRLLPSGCRLSRFKLAGSLPFLWAHKRDGEPDDVLGRVVAVEVKPDAVITTVEFDVEDNPKAARLLRRVKRGEIRACSVGFHCLREEPAADGVVDIVEWELCELSLCPIGSNAEALALRSLSRGFTLRRHGIQMSAARTPSRRNMKNEEILAKLGLAEGAAPDAIADALLNYLSANPEPTEAKALVVGMLSMLAPAPSSSSTSDGMAAAAAEAVADELRKAQARIAELEGKAQGDQPTAEQRADQAIRDGRWPVGQRAALVDQFKQGKTPFLFAPKSFSTRGANFTAGGNPTGATVADAAPRFGTDEKPITKTDTRALEQLKRMGVAVTPEQFAAARQ